MESEFNTVGTDAASMNCDGKFPVDGAASAFYNNRRLTNE